MADRDQVKPLAPAAAVYQTSSDEEGATRWRSSQYLRKRRCVLCGGCCLATVIILGVIILALALTVFKIKDPELTMNSIVIDRMNVDAGTPEHPVSVNATLTADVSIKNPNAASFRFDNSTTEFYYHGNLVGVAYAPNGKVSPDRTVTMNVTVDVLTDRVVAQQNVTDNILSGGLNLTSYTELRGRVNVLGIYKRDIDVMLNCTMTVDTLSAQEIKNKVCQANVK